VAILHLSAARTPWGGPLPDATDLGGGRADGDDKPGSGQSAQGAPEGTQSTPEGVSAAWQTLTAIWRALPWYGLGRGVHRTALADAGGGGRDGMVQHGSSDTATSRRYDRTLRTVHADRERFAAVVTIPANPVPSAVTAPVSWRPPRFPRPPGWPVQDWASFTWPAQMDHVRRGDCRPADRDGLELADDLEGDDCRRSRSPSTACRPTSTTAVRVRLGARRLARSGVHLGAYGRGLSAYGLAFSVIVDLGSYG